MNNLPQQQGRPTAGDQRARNSNARFRSHDHQGADIQRFAQPLDASWTESTSQPMFSTPALHPPVTDPESHQRQQYAQYQQWVDTYNPEQAQQNREAFMQQQQQQQQQSMASQSRSTPASHHHSLSGAFGDFPRPSYQQQPSVPVFGAQQQQAMDPYPQQYSQQQPPPVNNNIFYNNNYGGELAHVTPSGSADSFLSGTTSGSLQSLGTYTAAPNGVANYNNHTPSHSANSLSPGWPEGTRSMAQQVATPPNPAVDKPTQRAPKRPAATPKSVTKGASPSRPKRPRQSKAIQEKELNRQVQFQDRDESDSEGGDGDVDFVEGTIGIGTGGVGVTPDGANVVRPPGACSYCKKLKMKCEFPKKENTCRRCKQTGHVCVVLGRRRRVLPNKREYLLAQIRQKDAIIESLLKQLHNPYTATPLSIESFRMAMSPSDENNRDVHGWLDRMRSSLSASTIAKPTSGVSNPPHGGGSNANSFSFAPRPRQQDGNDSEGESPVLGSSKSVHQKLADEYGLNEPVNPEQDDEDDITTAQGVEKLQSLPDENVPLGLIANLSLDDARTQGVSVKKSGDGMTEDTFDDDVGVANKTYFLPGPASDLKIRALMIEQHSPPEILVHGLVSPNDVEKLFKIFYDRLNPFISLLDPVLHTPASTFARCPFLFTAICAVASRYYTEKSEIYPIAMHFAKHAAANALIDGWKSVELCQAYILMSTYAVPARRWEEDRSWLYTGLAIRIATDLNLHQRSTHKPANEKQEREALNRTRVWMICFNLDRSTATQFGKPSTIKEDYTMRNSRDWYQRSAYNHSYDIHLCGYTALLRIVARFHDEVFSDPDTPTGLNKQVNFRELTLEYDAQLSAYQSEWHRRFEEGTDKSDEGASFRCALLPFLVEYSRLVMFSFGFQQAFQRGMDSNDEVFFTKCLAAAKNVIRLMIEKLAPSGYMRYAPDGHFVFTSFASAFLLKMLKPEFSSYLSKPQETEVFDLIGRLIQTLSSNEIAIDDRHTPKLYARFLANLLSRHRRDGATVGRLHPQPPPPNRVENTLHGAPTAPTSSMFTFTSSFSAAQNPSGGSGPDPSSHYHNYTYNATPVNGDPKQSSTPIYRTEAFTLGSGPIQFGSDSDLLGLGLSMSPSDEEMLASMQAVTNPDWWGNVMMPGFSWPLDSPGLPPSASATTQLFA